MSGAYVVMAKREGGWENSQTISSFSQYMIELHYSKEGVDCYRAFIIKREDQQPHECGLPV